MPKLNRTSNSLKLGGGVTIKMTPKEQEFYQYHAGTIFNSKMEQLLDLIKMQQFFFFHLLKNRLNSCQ